MNTVDNKVAQLSNVKKRVVVSPTNRPKNAKMIKRGQGESFFSLQNSKFYFYLAFMIVSVT